MEKRSWVISAILPRPCNSLSVCIHVCPVQVSECMEASDASHWDGVQWHEIITSRTGDQECSGLALNLPFRFCWHFYSAGCLDPVWVSNSNTALPSPYDTDKRSKGKISSKVCLFLWCSYCRRKTKETLRKPVSKPEKAVLTTVFCGLFCFEVHSHQNMYFLDYSHSLWLWHHNWEFQHKLGVTHRTPQFRRASWSLAMG